MKKIDGQTPDLVAARIEELRTVFPEVFKDGKIDFDALQNSLGEYVEDAREKYSFTWAGKLDAIRLAQKRSTGTLRPCREESVDFDTTENLYIEGDNLEVLKLLSGSYMNRVKMIYIDPPYNKGKDFVYSDDFTDSIENYKKLIGEAAKSNVELSGRYHTNWLNMMFPRLKLARVLMAPDGVIFISIDEVEMPNLRKLCDEVFGEDNHIADFVWHNKRGGGNDAKHVAVEHEYVLMYAKNITELGELFVPYKPDYLTRYKEEDEQGKFFWDTFKRKSGKQYYPITCPDGTVLENDELGNPISWLRSEPRFRADVKVGEIRFLKINKNWSVQFKQRLPEGKKPRTIFLEESIFDEQGTTGDGSAEVLELMRANVFDNPKPLALIEHLINFHVESGDIVLDFFSGSSTTAHAVMRLNQDGKKRRFIMVQFPENLDKNLDKADSGSKKICENAITLCDQLRVPHVLSEVAKERIRRAGEKIKNDNPTAELDTGFKVFKLDASNLRKWDNSYTRDYEELAQRVFAYYDYLLPDRKPLDLVYEIMLKYSLPLTLPVAEITAANATAHIITHAGDDSVDAYKVLICMQPNLTIEQMEALSAVGAGTLFFADMCFIDTNAMTNCDEILKKAGQEMRLF